MSDRERRKRKKVEQGRKKEREGWGGRKTGKKCGRARETDKDREKARESERKREKQRKRGRDCVGRVEQLAGHVARRSTRVAGGRVSEWPDISRGDQRIVRVFPPGLPPAEPGNPGSRNNPGSN